MEVLQWPVDTALDEHRTPLRKTGEGHDRQLRARGIGSKTLVHVEPRLVDAAGSCREAVAVQPKVYGRADAKDLGDIVALSIRGHRVEAAFDQRSADQAVSIGLHGHSD